MMGKVKKFDVFISYSWKDEEFVKLLCEVLKSHNVTFFLDKSDLKIYDKFTSALKQNIARSKFLISIISSNYLESYWCLFEAIEAISTEQVNKKFLPLILKYNPEDEGFDEYFVLRIIKKLSSEIHNLEHSILEHKAYDLSPKLDKLTFIRSHLPKVLIKIQDHLYPEFQFWDLNSLLTNFKNVVNYIKPNAVLDLSECVIAPKRSLPKQIKEKGLELPTIKWSTYVGKQKWKNTPLVLGNEIFVGSAGRSWNEDDEIYGVYCVNGNSGEIKWKYLTKSDVNEVNYFDGCILAGCDNGTVICLSAKTGNLKWMTKLASGVTSKIYKDVRYEQECFIVVTYDGDVCFLDFNNGNIVEQFRVNENVMGNVVQKNSEYKEQLYIQTLNGHIHLFENDISGHKPIRSFSINYPGLYSSKLESNAEIYSSPMILGNQLIVAFARQTYYDYPPIISFDLESGNVNWIASDNKVDDSVHYGNIRGNLIHNGEFVLFVHAYANELVAMSPSDGRVKWKVGLGRAMFQQWATPIVFNNSAYIPRYDGFLYNVDLETKTRNWAIYLGEHADAGTVFDNNQNLPNESERTEWELYKGYPLISTPAVFVDNLIVGTDEGYLYCLANP